jgi:hypothetical protein
MSRIKVGHYEQDGGTIYLPLGFIPDYIRLCDFHTSTNIIFYEWWESMEDDQAAAAQEGISITEGVTARLADDAGVAAYDTGTQYPAAGTGAGQLQQWTASTSYTARTTTAEGSFCRPTNSSTTDRDAIFECTTGGTSGSTEPTWPDAIGGTVLDSTPIWERVNKVFGRSGYQGLQIEDNIQTDGQEMYYLAIQADESIDHGDVTGWASGVYDSSTD